MSSEASSQTAEERFRAAFDRLRTNRPATLEVGTPVSQNNVAKEAGCDPSALRKSRFPSLVREIQAYIEVNAKQLPSIRQRNLLERRAKANVAERLAQVTLQRDSAQAQLVSAHQQILDLLEEKFRLESRLEACEVQVRPVRST